MMYPHHPLQPPSYCSCEGLVGSVRSGHHANVPSSRGIGRGSVSRCLSLSLPAMGPSRLQLFSTGFCV